MFNLKKLLNISLLFVVLFTSMQQHCLGNAKREKNKNKAQKKSPQKASGDLNVSGKLNVAGSSTFNDVAYAKQGLKISNGDLSIANPAGSKNFLKVNADGLSYSGKTATFQNYSFDLVKNQLVNKPFYSTQKSTSIKKKQKGMTRATNLELLPMVFTEFLNDTTYSALHGVYLKFKVILGGSVDSSPVEAFYDGDLYILPPTDSEGSATLTVVNESTTTLVGSPITFNATITGTGDSATTYLTSSTNVDNAEITYYCSAITLNLNSLG